jgi:hypothetical protein
VTFVQDSFRNERATPSIERVFDDLGAQFEYALIEEALMALHGPEPGYGVLWPVTGPRCALVPSTAWDALEDTAGVSSIQSMGVRAAVSRAVAIDRGERTMHS